MFDAARVIAVDAQRADGRRPERLGPETSRQPNGGRLSLLARRCQRRRWTLARLQLGRTAMSALCLPPRDTAKRPTLYRTCARDRPSATVTDASRQDWNLTAPVSRPASPGLGVGTMQKRPCRVRPPRTAPWRSLMGPQFIFWRLPAWGPLTQHGAVLQRRGVRLIQPGLTQAKGDQLVVPQMLHRASSVTLVRPGGPTARPSGVRHTHCPISSLAARNVDGHDEPCRHPRSVPPKATLDGLIRPRPS